MKIHDLLWLVGFYEGEGSTGCYKFAHYTKKKTYWSHNLVASISQKELRVIKTIKRLIGFGRIHANRNSGVNKITMWRWKVAHKDARKFLRMILPYMKHPGKIAQVKLALFKDRKFVNPDYYKRGVK